MKRHQSQKNDRLTVVFATGILLLVFACGSQNYKFSLAEPVERENDTRPIAPPAHKEFHRFTYRYDILLRRPAVRSFSVEKARPAMDVNALDRVPASMWYTPRLGYHDLSPDELLHGVENIGPPQLPVKISKVKKTGNPGFFAEDARGKKYLVKFDPPEFPGIETTTALVVNRLFWGFGFNVPEDYLVYLRREDLRIKPGKNVSEEDVEKTLALVAAPEGGKYRATFSFFIQGVILGPMRNLGVRADDPNDKIPHENRRLLRGLKVFAALTNHSDIRTDNALDVYIGEPNNGYVKHYLLDFGEAFGGHGAEHQYLWDGFTHIFGFKDIFRNLLTLGLDVQDWEHVQFSQWKSVGAFEAEKFNPATWKEVYPFEPFRHSQPADDYWAAKIVAALTREHIETLVKAAEYPEDGAERYMVETLMKRREKVIDFFFNRVSPLEAIAFSDNRLSLQDMRIACLGPDDDEITYEILFKNNKDGQILERRTITADGEKFDLTLPDGLLKKSGGYLRVDVLVLRNGKRAPAPAQFHIRRAQNDVVKLVGVVH